MTDSLEPLTKVKVTAVPVPDYLIRYYHWAYVAPSAIRFWDHHFLVQLILFGQYKRLKDRTRMLLRQGPTGHLLQIACVYGSLSHDLLDDLQDNESLTVLDVVAEQLLQVQRKNSHPHKHHRLRLLQADSQNIPCPSAHYSKTLLFFLLHEQPEPVRRQTVAEALRVLQPNGLLIIVDYHRPARLHPLRPLVALVFRFLEPFAHDLWAHHLDSWLYQEFPEIQIQKTTHFAGLYQILQIRKSS